MQHVRIREHHVRALADRGALLLRRVAVVDRVAQRRDLQLRRGCAPGPARAPWSDTGRAPARAGRRPARAAPGRLKHSDLPLAVPVVTIVCAAAHDASPRRRPDGSRAT